MKKIIFAIFYVLCVSTVSHSASQTYQCNISEIRNGERLEDVSMPPLSPGADHKQVALADSHFIVRTWTYVGSIGMEIVLDNKGVLAQSRTHEAGFTNGELWYHPKGNTVDDDCIWVICKK